MKAIRNVTMRTILSLIITFISITSCSNLTAEEYYKRGLKKLHPEFGVGNDCKGAIEDFTDAIEINPQYSEAYNERGYSKFLLKDNNGAIEDFTKAIQINPNNSFAFVRMGDTNVEMEDYNKAIINYTNAIQISPDYYYAYFNRGKANIKTQEYEKAISDLKNVLDKPNSSAYWYSSGNYFLGVAHFELKSFEKANNYFSIELEYSNEIDRLVEGDVYFKRGDSRLEIRDYPGAVADFTKAIEIGPRTNTKTTDVFDFEYEDAYFKRGYAKSILEDYKGALADFEEVIRINPQAGGAYLNRGLIMTSLGQNENACIDYSKAGELGIAKAYEMIKKYCKNK